MKHMRTPRFWLLTTAALIFGSHTAASAQTSSTYNYGTPTMVGAAPGLPSVPAEQIARDVTSDYNPRSRRTELVAAPFDPFEEDPSLAGSLRLRSAKGAIAVDGRLLKNGVMVEVDFYYNSPSDDPYGGRNYSDASFVNGQLAPVVLRDTRILECSTRVDNVVYDHNNYYSHAPQTGIYRPYRHYAGHSAFGFGFGSSYFGPGYNYYNRNRSRYDRNRGYSNRSNLNRLVLGGARGGGRGRSDANRDRHRDTDRGLDRGRERDRDRGRYLDGNRDEGRVDLGTTPRTDSRGLTAEQRERRLRALQTHGSALSWSGASRRRGGSTLRSETTQPRIAIGVGSAQPDARPETRTESRPPKVAPRISQSDSKRPKNRARRAAGAEARQRIETRQRSETRRGEPRIGVSSRPETRPEPKRSEPKKSRSPKRSEPSSSRSSSSKKSKAKRAARSFFDFFPNSGRNVGYGGREVVTSRSVDCAREDKLQVFIPNERLDAARFDGLTLIALDAQGGETPIFIPPNYIEGFRLASSGRIRPQGNQMTAPVAVNPSVGSRTYGTTVPNRAPNRVIEAAPCPAGTSKQPDGTCLQGQVTGYPIR